MRATDGEKPSKATECEVNIPEKGTLSKFTALHLTSYQKY